MSTHLTRRSIPEDESVDFSCDRRLSRVARYILLRDVLPIVRYYYENDQHVHAFLQDKGIHRTKDIGPSSKSKSYSLQLQLYHHMFTTILQTIQKFSNSTVFPSKCILNPQLDPFWMEESHFYSTRPRIITAFSRFPLISSLPSTSYSSHAFKARDPHSTDPTRKTNVFQLHVCGMCGKSFLSRHYLDLHWETQHFKTLPESESVKICPATDLCSMLGLCPFLAKDLEPMEESMYEESSHSLDSKSQFCNRTEMTQSRTLCYTTMRQCFALSNGSDEDWTNHHYTPSQLRFVSSWKKDMEYALCERLDCEHYIHALAFAAFPSKNTLSNTPIVPSPFLLGISSSHHWKDTWDQHHSVYWFEWIGISFLLILMIALCIVNIGGILDRSKIWERGWKDRKNGSVLLVDESRRKKLD